MTNTRIWQYNRRMPCPEYDLLHAQWGDAHRKDSQALNPDASTVRGMSSSKLSNWRVTARRELLASESQLNSHIRGCVACQSDGRKPIFDSSQAHE